MSRSNWSQSLSRPVHVRAIGALRTLADARRFVLETIPPQFQELPTWRYVAGQLLAAADGGDVLDATLSLEIALALAGVSDRVHKA